LYLLNTRDFVPNFISKMLNVPVHGQSTPEVWPWCQLNFLLALLVHPGCDTISFLLLPFEYLHKDEMLCILAYLLIKLIVTPCI
jgi:hypothetical protein